MRHAAVIALLVCLLASEEAFSSEPGEPGRLVVHGNIAPHDLSVDPEGRWLAAISSGELVLYSITARTPVARSIAPRFGLDVAFVANGRWLHSDGRWLVPATNLDAPTEPFAGADSALFAIARRSDAGLAFIADPSSFSLRSLRVAAGDDGAARVSEAQRWPTDELCSAVGVDAPGKVGLAACGSKWHVVDLRHGTLRSFAAPAVRPTYLELWLSPDGRSAAAFDKSSGSLALLDLTTGVAKRVDYADELVDVEGVDGAKPHLIALDKAGSLSEVDLAGHVKVIASRTGARNGARHESTGATFLASWDASPVRMLDTSGRAAGTFAAGPLPLASVCGQRGPELTVVSNLHVVPLVIDLASGFVRPQDERDRHDLCALDARTNIDDEPIVYLGATNELIAVDGLASVTGVTWNKRIDERWFAFARGAEIAVVDLAKRRLVRWLATGAAPEYAHVDVEGRWLVTLGKDRRLRSFDLATGKRLAEVAAPWPETTGIEAVLISGKELILSASDGIYTGGVETLALVAGTRLPLPVTWIAHNSQLNRLGMATYGSVHVCTIAPAGSPPECKTFAGSSPRFIAEGRKLALVNVTGGLEIYDVLGGRHEATIYVSNNGIDRS